MADLIEQIDRVRRLARGQEDWSMLMLSARIDLQRHCLMHAHSVRHSIVRPGDSIPDPKPLRVYAEEICDRMLADMPITPEQHRLMAEYVTDRIRTHALER